MDVKVYNDFDASVDTYKTPAGFDTNKNVLTFNMLGQDSIKFGNFIFYYFENVKVSKQKSLASHKILFANSDFNEDCGFDSARITATLFFYNNVDSESWDIGNKLRSHFMNVKTPKLLMLPTGESYNAKLKSLSASVDVKHLDGYKVEVEWVEELLDKTTSLYNKVFTSSALSTITTFIPGPIKELETTANLVEQFNSKITNIQQFLGKANLLQQRGVGYVTSVLGKLNDVLGLLSILENNAISNSFFMVKAQFDELVNQCSLSRQQIIDQIRLMQNISQQPTRQLKVYPVPTLTTPAQLATLLGISQDDLKRHNPNLGLIIYPSTMVVYE